MASLCHARTPKKGLEYEMAFLKVNKRDYRKTASIFHNENTYSAFLVRIAGSGKQFMKHGFYVIPYKRCSMLANTNSKYISQNFSLIAGTDDF